MKWFKIFVVSSIVILFVLFLYLLLIENKIAYINTSEVYNEFAMTKEINSEVKKVEVAKKQILDSLVDIIRKVDAGVVKMEEKQYGFLRKEYTFKNKQFSEEISNMKQANSEKIWKQINQYVSDFGKKNKYKIVLGANGQGGLMYADENIDITKVISEYINEKYNGKK